MKIKILLLFIALSMGVVSASSQQNTYDKRYKFAGKMFGLVAKGGDYGAVDIYGKEVIPCKYDNIKVSGDLFVVTEYDSDGVINASGRTIFNVDYGIFYDIDNFGYICQSDYYTEEMVLFNRNGNAIYRVADGSISDYSNGYFAVRDGGKGGYINNFGKVVVPLVWDATKAGCDNGLFCVKRGDKWGYVNSSNSVVIGLNYDGADGFINGYAKVMMHGEKSEDSDDIWSSIAASFNDRYGIINAKGEQVFAIVCKDIKPHPETFFSSGFVPVRLPDTGKWVGADKDGYIRTEGYDSFEPFYDGVAVVGMKEGGAEEDNSLFGGMFGGGSAATKYKYGLIDANGKMLTEIKYDSISRVYNGVCVAAEGDVYKVLWSKTGGEFHCPFADWSYNALEGALYVVRIGSSSWYELSSDNFEGVG